MGFDAGSITARLKLDRTEFNDGLDKAEAKAQEFADKTITPNVGADTAEFDRKAEEVAATKRDIAKAIAPDVGIEDSDFTAKAAEIEAEKKILGESVTIDVKTSDNIGKSFAKDFAKALDSGGANSPLGGILQQLMDKGATRNELAKGGLPGLGYTKAEIRQALEAMSKSIQRESLGVPGLNLYSLLTGERIANNYVLTSGEKQIIQRLATEAKDAFGKQLAIGSGTGTIATDLLGNQLQLGSGDAKSGGGEKGLFGGLAAGFASSIMGGFAQARQAIASGGGIGALFKSALTSGQSGFSSLGPMVQAGLLGSPVVAAMAQALGLAAAGALAGTAIGGAGFLAFAGLAKGVVSGISTAYTATQTLQQVGTQFGTGSSQYAQAKQQYQTTVGALDPKAVSTAADLAPAISSISGAMTSAEQPIYGMVDGLVKAFAKALPVIMPFINAAVGAMKPFFDAIDRGMNSPGFKSFMKAMTGLVGPLMKEFGGVILNLGRAFGNFLKLFGPDALAVGGFFVSLSKGLADFLGNAKIGTGPISDMKSVFHDLGDVLSLVWAILKSLFIAFEPIGVVVLKIIGPVAKLAAQFLNFIPKPVLVALGTVALLILAIVAPITLVIASITALVVAGMYLVVHWRQIWTDIKNWATDAWHAIYNNVASPLIDFFTKSIPHAWDNVWHFFTGIPGKIASAFKGVGDVLLAPFRWGFNEIAKAWNNTVGRVGFHLPSWIPGIGGKGFNMPRIPSWADGTGTGTFGPGLALVGERGPELVNFNAPAQIIPNHRLGGTVIYLTVDARGSTNPAQTEAGAARGVNSSIPALRSALARGSAA